MSAVKWGELFSTCFNGAVISIFSVTSNLWQPQINLTLPKARGWDDKSLRPDKNRNRLVPHKVKRRRPLKIVNLAESFLRDNAPGVS